MSFLSSALRFTAGVGVSFLTVLGFAEGQTRTRLAVPNPSPVGRVVLEGSVDVLGYVGGHEQTPTGVVTFVDGETTLGSVSVSPLGAAQATLSAGRTHACALTRPGGVECWGDNAHGQLGNGTKTKRARPIPVVGLGSGVIAVAAGSYHTCALTESGVVKCWGDNSAGQLGAGAGAASLTPVTVSGLSSGVMSIVAGFMHNCAVTRTGHARCWGQNTSGQLGNGSTAAFSPPTTVGGPPTTYSGLAASSQHTCGVTSAGALKCWGGNSYGQLGDGTRAARLLPITVSGLASEVVSVTTGDFHTCAVTAAHALKCWGANAKGQLGDGTKTTRLTPVGVLGFTRGAIVAAAGGQHSCAVSIHPPTEPYESFSGLSNAWCWGYGHSGQLGNGALYNSFTPVRVLRKAHNSSYVAVAITTGEDFSCERLESATVKCWGDNAFGQSGSGEFNGAFGTPRPALTSSDCLRARARLGTRALAIGQHLLRAIYPGDASHEPSTSAVVPLTVQ